MDNYEIARDRAQEYFLNFDQAQILRRWQLTFDAHAIYVTFLGKEYAVCRENGRIIRCADGTNAGFSEVLSILDLLCHKAADQYLTGRYAPVNSLKNAPKAGGVATDFHPRIARCFDDAPEKLHRACLALGGKPVPMGDIGYRLPVFGGMDVILKFYHSDEDFPASITLLWDENTLNFIYYETVFYICGYLLQTLADWK